MLSDEKLVVQVCFCGSRIFRPEWVMFEDYEISAYSLNMECALCGAEYTTPTEIDRPDD